MNKELFRKEMKDVIQKIPTELHVQWSTQIANHLFNLKEWHEAKTVGITISREKEILTKPIIEEGWKEKKQMAVPKCHPKIKKMTFREITNFEQLEVVYYGLEEPIESITNPIMQENIDLLIIPGLAFDENGYRLGFGGGYYDRYLAGYNGMTIALAFKPQIVQKIPIEQHDLPVNLIITNEKVIQCNVK
ncbi:5-formyltetrahydrofolate cyclo-ligase [Bacillus sp. Marseille-P3661]|uniref:5-formyltetrahydrofolate cyclo-ligase n=1 Tax=Bacillus sp. Marseille-P3661 TaxID=1936234 RepID=UPI000C835CCC|nr:5-formyltetrahydrofolate cyclo-ligase [Bacillus sp. Marseille-P3661]